MSKKDAQIDRICSDCGKPIGKDDNWYPFFDISTCGGGIQYLHARCAVERIYSTARTEMLERVTEAEKEKDEPLSDGLMNFYWRFPISPIHWIRYAMNQDFEEVKQLVEETERRDKGETAKQEESVKMKKKQK